MTPRAAAAATGVAVAGATGTLAALGPHLPGVACPFRSLTGIDCPGCGAIRASAALLDGDLVAALDHNMLTVAALPLLAWAWISWIAHPHRVWHPLAARHAATVAAVAVIGFWAVRVAPWPIGDWLASPLSG